MYSLFIAPAFILSSSPGVRMRIIALLNSIYMCIAVFPALLFAQSLTKSRYLQLLIVALTLLADTVEVVELAQDGPFLLLRNLNPAELRWEKEDGT